MSGVDRHATLSVAIDGVGRGTHVFRIYFERNTLNVPAHSYEFAVPIQATCEQFAEAFAALALVMNEWAAKPTTP